MKKLLLLTSLGLFAVQLLLRRKTSSWHMAGDKITSPWADSVKPCQRIARISAPATGAQQLDQPEWACGNMPLFPKTSKPPCRFFQGNILVPFAVESALSGVGKTVGKDSVLWYKRTCNTCQLQTAKTTLLHFGAVDWHCDVYVNGTKAGSHEGGFDPFTIDITSALKKGTKQDIAISVWDPTDRWPQPSGKQVKNPRRHLVHTGYRHLANGMAGNRAANLYCRYHDKHPM